MPNCYYYEGDGLWNLKGLENISGFNGINNDIAYKEKFKLPTPAK